MSSLGTQTGGADAEQWACNGSYNQTWYVGEVVGALFIQNEHDQFCLNNYRGNFSNNNPQTLWPCSTGASGGIGYMQAYQIFLNRYHSGYYYIETKTSSFNPSGYCLTSLGNRSNGSIVYESACDGSANQAWEGGTLSNYQ